MRYGSMIAPLSGKIKPIQWSKVDFRICRRITYIDEYSPITCILAEYRRIYLNVWDKPTEALLRVANWQASAPIMMIRPPFAPGALSHSFSQSL